MDWAEDLKFSIRKTTAKMGRRAGNNSSGPQTPVAQTNSPEGVSSPELNLDISFDNSETVQSGGPPRRISGGWAESATKTRSLSKSNSEDERFSKSKSFDRTTLEDDIPIIPDLDEIQDDILMSEITEPPSVAVNRVVTLKELNSDLLNQKAFTSLEDVDLSILTKNLQSQTQLEDEDVPWEWEKLFTEITAEIHSEKPLSADRKNSNTKNLITNDEIIGGQIQFLS